jgi:U6 snRNA-associated Sm-like protein LSm7
VLPDQAGRKETALDLAKFVDKGVQVKLTGGRQGRFHIPNFSSCS